MMKKLFIFFAVVMTALSVMMCAPPAENPGGAETYNDVVWFVQQPNAPAGTSATLDAGTIAVTHATASGDLFKYGVVDDVSYSYLNNNACFLVFPVQMSGDFSVVATITVGTQNQANNSSGVAVGIIENFDQNGPYFFNLMRNANNQAVRYHTKGTTSLTSVGTGGSSVTYTAGDTMTISVRRASGSVYWNMANVTQSLAYTEQTTSLGNVYGCAGDAYAGIAFGNVDATITDFVIADGAGKVVFNSDTGTIESHIPSSLLLSDTTIELPLSGSPVDVTATAIADGGAVATVSLSGYDTGIISASVVNGVSASTITITPVAAGTTTITVTNNADTGKTRNILVAVSDFATSDPYGPLTSVYPAVDEGSAYTDGELRITFDNVPTLNGGGTIRIYTADGTEVDSIGFADESQTAWSTVINVDDQLARVEGNSVYFTPHFGILDFNTEYYIAIPTTAITAVLNGQTFTGFTNDSSIASWSFTTTAAPTLSAAGVTVDNSESSSADFRSLQGALTYLATGLPSDDEVTIDVAAGTYRELVYYKGGKSITVQGPDGNNHGDTCIIHYKNSSQLNGSTHTRASFYFSASSLVLKNVALQNTWIRSGGSNQAETIHFANANYYVDGHKTLAAYNCSFISNQDTILTSGKNWFYNCYIEGNTDYIWGTSDVALFENCSLRCVNDGLSSEAHIFVSRTPMTAGTPNTIGKGYVLIDSTVSVDSGLTADFGRNPGGSGFYDQVALLNVTFSGAGSLLSTLWYNSSTYYYLDDASHIGWKAQGCTGLGADTYTTLTNTAANVAAESTEYDSRDHILNRNVTWDGGTTFGFENDTTYAWDISSLESDFGL